MWLVAVVEGVPPDVRTVRHAGLTAAVVPDDSGVRATSGLFLQHAAIVQSLLHSCPAVLPVRAGTRLAGEDDVRQLLSDREDELRRGLQRVRGAVELAVACLPPAWAPARSVMSGREYLERSLRQWRWADDVADRISALDALGGVREVRVLSHAPSAVKASLLVEAPRADVLRREVPATVPSPGGVRCTGPFPAYSFSNLPAAVAA